MFGGDGGQLQQHVNKEHTSMNGYNPYYSQTPCDLYEE